MIRSIVVAAFLLPPVFQPSYGADPSGNFTFSGIVKDAETGEALIGATIVIEELKTGAASNAYGFYSITARPGTYTVDVSFIGYRTIRDTIALDHDQKHDFRLEPQAIKVGGVEVTAERNDKNVTSTSMSVQDLQVREVNAIPVLLGEKDILKTIQLLPGIKSAGEGSTGFYARGGAIDENLIVLDEAPVYNASHILGYLSIFNSDAIKDVKMMTGDIPAEYGGRLSSVIDVRTNDGDEKNFGAMGGIGLLDSRITVDGPIVRDRGSFIVSARRTYADLFLRLSSDTLINRARLYFYDLNAKASYQLGDNDRVFLSGYYGRDNFGYTSLLGFNWGNTTATLRWNHIFGDQFFSNTSLIYSDYSYANTVSAGTTDFTLGSGIRDLNFKTDLQYFTGGIGTVKFGLNAVYHTFNPGVLTSTTATNNITIEKRYALENAAYASDEVELSQRFKLDYGIRLSSFSLLGPAHLFTYDASGEAIDTATYGSGAFVHTFTSLEPRVSLTYLLDDVSSVKASYNRTAQYLHLLSNSTTTNPNDLWVPSSNNVPPQHADQYAVGYFRNFNDNEYETSLELYYKNISDLIDYKNGADLQLNPTVEALLDYGRGWSYGAELLIKRRFGAVNGWIGYTLSRTEEQFPLINGGRAFPARQDITHDISIVVIYDYSDTWTFGATWVYYTGNAVTFPSGNYRLSAINNTIVPYYTERNGYRMPPYHRLDLSATYTLGPHSNLNFSIYNAYDRWNPYSIIFRQDPNDLTKTQAVQVTIFPIIPSISYNFNF